VKVLNNFINESWNIIWQSPSFVV